MDFSAPANRTETRPRFDVVKRGKWRAQRDEGGQSRRAPFPAFGGLVRWRYSIPHTLRASEVNFARVGAEKKQPRGQKRTRGGGNLNLRRLRQWPAGRQGRG